jgi:hypothetical protein
VILRLALVALLAATLALNFAPSPRCDVGAEEDIGCARGFETRERDGRSFRWTDGAAAIQLAGAGYGAPLIAEVTLAAPRPPDLSLPRLTLTADDTRVTLSAPPLSRRYQMLLPAGFPRGDLTTLTLTSDTFRPTNDRRDLGVAVYAARLIPLGGTRMPGPLLVLALLGVGLAAATFARARSRQRASYGERLCARTSVRAMSASLLAIVICSVLWTLLPERVVPFLPVLALILGVTVIVYRSMIHGEHEEHVVARANRWSVPAGDSSEQSAIGYRLSAIALAVLVGAGLDALLVTGIGRSWSALIVVAQAGVALGAVWYVYRRGGVTLAEALGVALAVRLLGFAARLLTGSGGSDPDVELFYSYGRAAIELGAPITEYPSGALLTWALLALPASRELFALLLPLLNTAADLAVVWGLWKIAAGSGQKAAGKVYRSARCLLPAAFPLFYALSPLLLPFWWAKYDALPAALVVLGLAAFASGRSGWAGAALGLGGAVKWAPWLAAPVLGLYLLRPNHAGTQARGHEDGEKDRKSFVSSRLRAFVVHRPLLRFAIGGLLAVAVLSLPLVLRDSDAFLAPYQLQGGRGIIGESVWFLPALLLDSSLVDRIPAPWSAVEDSPVPRWLVVGVQAAALGGLALAMLIRAPDQRRALALAALAPALFLLLNRVFSPQYMAVITACALAAGTVALRGREPLALVALLAVAQAANLLVWPNTVSWWVGASAVMFAASGAALLWLAARAYQEDAYHEDAKARGDAG